MNNISIQDVTNIYCIGATKVGVFTTLVAAEKWPQKNFFVVDRLEANRSWIDDPLRHREPGLQHILQQRIAANVTFETPNYDQQVNQADMIIIAADVNTKQKGVGKRKRLDLCDWDRDMRKVLVKAQQAKFIVIKSLLPPDKALASIQNIVDDLRVVNNTVAEHHIFWVQEFFSNVTALDNLRNLRRVVISPCLPPENPNTALIRDFYLTTTPVPWVANPDHIITTDISSGILGKMGKNVKLATEAALTKAVSQLCEDMPGSDSTVVQQIMEIEPPNAGICEPEWLRDVAYFSHLAQIHGNDPVARFFNSIIKINSKRRH